MITYRTFQIFMFKENLHFSTPVHPFELILVRFCIIFRVDSFQTIKKLLCSKSVSQTWKTVFQQKKNVFPKKRFSKKRFPKNGFPKNGFPKNGFPKSGFPKNGFLKKWFSKKRFSKTRFSKKRFSQKWSPPPPKKKRCSQKRFSKTRVFQKRFSKKTVFHKNGCMGESAKSDAD